MSLEFEYGVLFRARSGASELFDCPLSRRSARDVARLLARRWRTDVEVLPCGRDGTPLGEVAFGLGDVEMPSRRRSSRLERV